MLMKLAFIARILARFTLRTTRVLAIGCATITSCTVVTVPHQDPLPLQTHTVLEAGVSEEDITPPPGLPMFGYSVDAKRGAGFRTRLFARAIVLDPPDGKVLAFVVCDLGASSSLLHKEIARRIAQRTPISFDRLMLSATHTHSGPGGYSGDRLHDNLASATPGFDDDELTFLADRIAKAVDDAYASRGPAELAIGQTELWGITRNRSFNAFVSDSYHEDPPITSEPYTDSTAVDPTITVLRIDRIVQSSTIPIGALVNFSIHGTVVDSENDLYSGDVQAVVERHIEERISQTFGGRVVVAVSNGAEGDVEGAYELQGFPETERLGKAVGSAAVELFDTLSSQMSASAVIGVDYREASISEPSPIEGISLCQPGVVGFPKLGGAKGGRSFLFAVGKAVPWLIPAAEGGKRKRPRGCQGYKIKALWGIQDVVLYGDSWPHYLTIQTVRINNYIFLALPGEFSVEMGARLKHDALVSARVHGLSITKAVIIGLANQYADYVTTPEEYDMQYYEGASMVFGPKEGSWISDQVTSMIAEMSSGTTHVLSPAVWSFTTGIVWGHFPPKERMKGSRRAGAVILGAGSQESIVEFTWHDVGPSEIDLDRPLVRLEQADQTGSWAPLVDHDGVAVDDQGIRLEVRMLPSELLSFDSGRDWRTTWYSAGECSNSPLRFVIASRSGKPELTSPSFLLLCNLVVNRGAPSAHEARSRQSATHRSEMEARFLFVRR
jgi:neutral ceramidase